MSDEEQCLILDGCIDKVWGGMTPTREEKFAFALVSDPDSKWSLETELSVDMVIQEHIQAIRDLDAA